MAQNPPDSRPRITPDGADCRRRPPALLKSLLGLLEAVYAGQMGLSGLAGQQPPSMWILSRNISRRRSSEYPSVFTTESQSDTS